MRNLKFAIFSLVCLLLPSISSLAQIKKKTVTVVKKPATAGQTYAIGVTVNAVGTGESFVFSLGAGKQIAVTQGGVLNNFSANLVSGQSYIFSQLSGPRTCSLSANRVGTITSANVEIQADCGLPAGFSLLSGIFTARPGTSVVVANNVGNDLTLAAKIDGNATYSRNSFNFLTPFADGSNYNVTIKSAPAGQLCSVYAAGQGVIPENADRLRIGCDINNDLVSRSTDDKKFGTFYESSAPVVSGNGLEEGRYIAFISSAAGLGGSTGKKRQIIWRDRNTGETKSISVGANGEEGNGDSFAPSISADGQSVAFESYATNLVPIDTNGVRDIFVWSGKTNTVTAVSTGAGEVETNAESFDPSISGDGSLVAFSSGASNLAPGVSGINTINVYLKKVGSGESPILISVDEKTRKGVGGSNPSISEDGRRLAFYSFASTLVANDRNNLWDIFLWESSNRKLKRISVTATGGERNQGTESASRVVAPSISGNGRFVTFATTATNMVSGDDNNTQDIFVVDVENGERLIRASLGTDGVQGNGDSPGGQGEKIGISFDGKWVVFSTNASNLGGNIILRNILSGETRVISSEKGSGVGRPAISREGGYVVFGTSSRLDSRFTSSGLFATYTGIARCRFCPE